MPPGGDGQSGSSDSPYPADNFELRIDGEPIAGFTAVSGLTMEVETVDYREGGVEDHVHRLPGQGTHANLTLERGLSRETKLFDWVRDVMRGQVSRRTVVLRLLDRAQGDTCWGWEFSDAYPVTWNGPDLTSAGGGMAIESVELVYRRLSTLPGPPD